MILQEEEKHKNKEKSRVLVPRGVQPASQARPTGRTACQPDTQGGTQEAHRAFLDMVEQAGQDEPYYDHRVFDSYEIRNLDTEKKEPTPLLLTRGVQTEGLLPSPPQKTVIDWLTISANEPIDILKQFLQIFIPEVLFVHEDKGMQGYKKSIQISLHGENLGKIGYMGTSEKNTLVLSGNGTEKIKDWDKYTYWLKLLNEVSISQVHLALDDYEGLFMSHDIIRNAYDNKKFKSSKSRVNPSIDNKGKTTGEGINKGRTWDIGKNKSASKSFTGYEKGLEQFFQLFGKLAEDKQELLIPNLTLGDLGNIPEGVKLDTSILKWYRGEVKLYNRDIIIPIEILLERDNFYSSAYPFCEEILPMIEKKTAIRKPSSFEVSMEEMFLNCGNSYGSAIFTALSVAQNQGKDLKLECVEIVKKIIEGHCRLNQKLIKQGGLNQVSAFDPKLLKAPQDE